MPEVKKNPNTPRGRVHYPNLFEPRAYTPGQKPKYEVTISWAPGENLSELYKAADAAARNSKWANKLPPDFTFADEKTIPSFIKEDHRPFKRTQDGEIAAKFTSENRPYPIVDSDTRPITRDGAGEGKRIYGGCYGRVSFNAYSYDNESRGVKFGLIGFQKLGDGEPFGGARGTDEDFDAVEVKDELSEAEELFA